MKKNTLVAVAGTLAAAAALAGVAYGAWKLFGQKKPCLCCEENNEESDFTESFDFDEEEPEEQENSDELDLDIHLEDTNPNE